MEQAGVLIDGFGMPATSPSDRFDPLRPGLHALRHRRRHWTQARAAAACQVEPLLPVATRLRDLGGSENALWLRANAGLDLEPLDDLEWTINVRSRLDLPVGTPCLCQHRRATTDGSEGKRCLAPLDEFGTHAPCACWHAE